MKKTSQPDYLKTLEKGQTPFGQILREFFENKSGNNLNNLNKKITEEDEDILEEALYDDAVNPSKLRNPIIRLPEHLSDCNPTQGSTASQDRKITLLNQGDAGYSGDNDNYDEFQYTVLMSKRSDISRADSSKPDRFRFNKFRDNITFSSLTPIDAKIINSNCLKVIEEGKEINVILLVWSEGTTYQGELKNGLFHGKGLLKHAEGYQIEGFFKEGKVDGFAKFRNEHIVFEGQWLNSAPEGTGKEILYGVYEYEGNFNQGRKSGQGIMRMAGKGCYQGQFKDNLFHGEGKFAWENGRKFEGTWVSNKMHGKGKTTWPDGRKYLGKYANNNKDGFGHFWWADGREYYGYWKNGKQHGRGVYIDINFIKHEAEWENGRVIHSYNQSP